MIDFTSDRQVVELLETGPGSHMAAVAPGDERVHVDVIADGRYAYVTLGPGFADGGLVVLDTDSFEIVNCGTILSPDGARMYVNGGSLDVGHWYVFDTSTHELTHADPRNSFGLDAHGVALTPDGSELWMVNRATSNAIVVDTRTDAVIEIIPFVGESPDILTISPDGRFAFVSRQLVEIMLPEADLALSDFHGIGLRPLD